MVCIYEPKMINIKIKYKRSVAKMIGELKILYNERGLIISEIQDLIDRYVEENNKTVKNILDKQIDEKEYDLHEVNKKIKLVEEKYNL